MPARCRAKACKNVRSEGMNWSIPIGSVKGTVIRVHITFFLFLLWIGGVHYAQGGQQAAVRRQQPELGQRQLREPVWAGARQTAGQ